MIEVVRDAQWISILKDSVERDKIKDIKKLGFYFKLADTIWRARKRYEQIKQEKIDKRVKIVKEVDKKKVEPEKEPKEPKVNICQAKYLNGKPCRFKAVCGEFCKKHSKK